MSQPDYPETVRCPECTHPYNPDSLTAQQREQMNMCPWCNPVEKNVFDCGTAERIGCNAQESNNLGSRVELAVPKCTSGSGEIIHERNPLAKTGLGFESLCRATFKTVYG